MVLVPSLFVVMVCGGRLAGSSNSSSSAQSGRLEGGERDAHVSSLFLYFRFFPPHRIVEEEGH